MEHDNEHYLLVIVMLCEKLHREKILRPAIGTLESLVAGIRECLEIETYQRLSFLWTDEFRKNLGSLLEVDRQRKITNHRWLCNVPSVNTAKEINHMFEKIDFLTEMG